MWTGNGNNFNTSEYWLNYQPVENQMEMINQIISQEAESQAKLWNDYMSRIQQQQDRELMALGINPNAVISTAQPQPQPQLAPSLSSSLSSNEPPRRAEPYHLPFVVITKEKEEPKKAETKPPEGQEEPREEVVKSDHDHEKFNYFAEWFNQLTKQADQMIDERQNPSRTQSSVERRRVDEPSSGPSEAQPGSVEPEKEGDIKAAVTAAVAAIKENKKPEKKDEESDEEDTASEESGLPTTDGKLAYFEKWLIELSEQLSKEKAKEKAATVLPPVEAKQQESSGVNEGEVRGDEPIEDVPNENIELEFKIEDDESQASVGEDEEEVDAQEFDDIQTLDELADRLADKCLEGDFKKAAKLFYHVFAKRGHELRDEDDDHDENCGKIDISRIRKQPDQDISPYDYANFYNLIFDFPNLNLNQIY